MLTIFSFLLTIGAVFLTARLVPGIHFLQGWDTLLLVSIAWSAIVYFIKPVLKILMLPITFLTLGFSTVLVNMGLFFLMTLLIPGFSVDNVGALMLGALVLSFLTWVIHKIV